MLTAASTDSTQRIVLHDISWNTFEQMLAEMGNRRSARLAYYQGMLEIMSPSPRHERINRLLERFLLVLTEELGLEVCALGSTTWKKEQLAGVEPDACFYIQNELIVRTIEQRGREVDLSQDPPPDVIVEVDIASSSEPKFAIYAALKVPEIWLYRSEKLEVYHFDGTSAGYRKFRQSLAFPGIEIQQLMRFIKMASVRGPNATVQELRVWVREQIRQRPGDEPL
jgi:Uma2 family endonuclease